MASAHLVGSIPLKTPQEVFKVASAQLQNSLRRVPDGEVGERNNWIEWQADLFSCTEGMERSRTAGPDGTSHEYEDRSQYRLLKPAQEIELGALGYADAAIASYAILKDLKQKSEIRADLRLQVSLPTPIAVVNARVVPEDQNEFEPRYEEAMIAEIASLAEAIPHDELAVQWDVCIELGILEGVMPHVWGSDLSIVGLLEEVTSRIARLGAAVPEGIELGFHLCYGDYKHTHFMQPKDLGLCVRVSNAFDRAIPRTIDWIHMPVPADRDDNPYFEPLRGLAIDDGTELFLGCVHTDGLEATQRRADAARNVIDRSFGVATECGLARTPVNLEQLKELLATHRQVSIA